MRIWTFDTTLRDGTQREGISLSVADKLRITQLLDELGVAYVEGGWPVLKSGDGPADGDHDGMPDAYESANGLSPTDPADANGDSVGDGYTNLERYLNSIVTAKQPK